MVLGALYFCGPRDGTCDGFKVFHKHLQIRQGLGKGFIEWMFSILVSQRAGHVVAVKVFHEHLRIGQGGEDLRELELLRRLKHDNIISLHAIEQEVSYMLLGVVKNQWCVLINGILNMTVEPT